MALIGTYKAYKHQIDETKTKIDYITLPEDLAEGHPDYDNRGKTIEREVEWVDEIETIYENCYIQIISFMFYKRQYGEAKDEVLDLHFRVYESEEARREDFNNFIFEDHIMNKQVEQKAGDDLRTLGYELIKQQRGFENMQDSI